LSRNTIRKHLREHTVEPKFKVPDRPSRLDPFAEKLTGWQVTQAEAHRQDRQSDAKSSAAYRGAHGGWK
jgi:hypothetical protein